MYLGIFFFICESQSDHISHIVYSDVLKTIFSVAVSPEVSQKLHQLPQALLLGLELRLYEHVDQFLCVCLPSSYHLVQLGTEAIEEDTLLLTATPAVLGHGLRLNQLQRKGTRHSLLQETHHFLKILNPPDYMYN